MAVFYQARQRISDKRYDYTAGSDEEKWVHAVGYCGGWDELTPEREAKLRELHPGDHGDHLVAMIKRDLEEKLPFKSKFHTNGHATAREADACFEEFQLDNYFKISAEPEEQRKCADCGEWTTDRIGVNGPHSFGESFPACKKHQSRNVLRKLREAARQRWAENHKAV